MQTSIQIYWKIALILLGLISLSTGLSKRPGFWTSYVLDMAGPAWNYILIRGQYSAKQTFFSLRLSPELALFLIAGICFLIETSQFFKLYKAHFDPWDYLAYISILIPCYLIDKYISRYKSKMV
jgi:hypothetical protein